MHTAFRVGRSSVDRLMCRAAALLLEATGWVHMDIPSIIRAPFATNVCTHMYSVIKLQTIRQIDPLATYGLILLQVVERALSATRHNNHNTSVDCNIKCKTQYLLRKRQGEGIYTTTLSFAVEENYVQL